MSRAKSAKVQNLFIPRQLLALLTFARHIRPAYDEMLQQGYSQERAKAIATYLGLSLTKLADLHCSLASWKNGAEAVVHALARQALPMVWDFAESNSISTYGASWYSAVSRSVRTLQEIEWPGLSGRVYRGSATQSPLEAVTFDAVVTDPPYYDNVAYADLSDFFYVWLKRSVGFLHQEHFSSQLTPKKWEAVADATRHKGDRQQAARVYEQMMAQSFAEAGRVLKPGAPLAIVYAHKTTLGWATLVDALRIAGFTVTEAWPLDTEMEARIRAVETASLASSIFLVARRREGNETGAYETQVQPELEQIVRERVDTLWKQGVSGADLVIACVGAGLRAFTRFARVEYANGEEVPANKFLAEVEGVVLETLLENLFGLPRSSVSAVDAPTRFYVLWRYAYRTAAIDAGEAIVFTYPQGVELDGPRSLSYGSRALVEKQKNTYCLRDFTARGADEKLGLPLDSASAPLIDVLHRVLWLMENQPAKMGEYLDEARPDFDRLRVVAETLAGPKLAGNSVGGRPLIAARGAEAAALRVLTANWRTLIEAHRGALL
jgi:putative DNA methylase